MALRRAMADHIVALPERTYRDLAEEKAKALQQADWREALARFMMETEFPGT